MKVAATGMAVNVSSMKKCSVCHQDKPIDSFSVQSSKCKVCAAKYARERRKRRLDDFDFSSVSDGFWAKVKKTNKCWLWVAARDKYGYGKFCISGKDMHAHRVSYMLAFGFVPPEVWVCHSCDNPPCVKFGHLFLSTPQGNVADKVKKRRHVYGDNHPSAKITRKEARNIKRRYWTEKISQLQLGEEYGVSQAHVSKIVLGKLWKL